MVTSNKIPEKRVVKMAGENNIPVVPQRTLLGEVNEHIMCPLCRGYYIDATTIVECLHSFCRSCIIKHLQAKSYCPVCEMMINSAKPNIKLDKALQDIVYKLVPGLFQKEMERRQQFYSSRPGPAASATPEQRGEDTERIIFSPEDVISFSLEYADATDTDSISSKSSDSNEPQPTTAVTRRYLQCPAVVNISHLKKFLSMKFDIDSSQFAIDILYKRVPLPDYYTLMDIAYIYNWKRNEPMRFFYQIIDYIAIRNRFFDINRNGSHFRDRKSSPTSTEDTNVSSPAPNLNDHGSEDSSGADSPMPDDNSQNKHCSDMTNKCDKNLQPTNKDVNTQDSNNINKNIIATSSLKKDDEDVQKSQFLNSFELTAKNISLQLKSSPSKAISCAENKNDKNSGTSLKPEDTLKRKQQTSLNNPELKKPKMEIENVKMPNLPVSTSTSTSATIHQTGKTLANATKAKNENYSRNNQVSTASTMPSSSFSSKDIKLTALNNKQQISDNGGVKRNVGNSQNNTSSPKRKAANDAPPPLQASSTMPTQKTVSPLKLHIPKLESQSPNIKPTDTQKAPFKKMPDLKPSTLTSHNSQSKGQSINKVRMDLLANNSDPTIDRSKILSQVKTSLSSQNSGTNSGDPLKSIFDSCNINIPSSLSITLTDQKLDPRHPSESVSADQKKNLVNKNLVTASTNPSHKVPSPPVHNYIEILKLPDTDSKKQNKAECTLEGKLNTASKSDTSAALNKNMNKTSEISSKGPVPNLKPISDTKLGKQTGNFAAPITFQQTFEQQLQSLQAEKKPKLPKAKTQVPKLVPAPKVFNVVSKSTSTSHINKPIGSSTTASEPKSGSALDLSTPHSIPIQSGVQQTLDKALETMQSIANLAKKQTLPTKGLPGLSQSSTTTGMSNRPINPGISSLKVPSANNINQLKLEKPNVTHSNNQRQDISKNIAVKQSNNVTSISSSNYQLSSHTSPNTIQQSPRSQTRSPSSSPKLVIAEEKQANVSLEQNVNQSNLVMNSSLPNTSISKSESPKASPGPSKAVQKPGKTSPVVKIPSTPVNPAINTPLDYLPRPPLMSPQQHHLFRQVDFNAWLKLQRQYDLIKSMSSMAAHQTQNDFNNKDKQ